MGSERAIEARCCDLEYCCHFIGMSGVVEGVRLFSSPNDAAATLEAMMQLRMRADIRSVELWKAQRLIGRYPGVVLMTRHVGCDVTPKHNADRSP